MVRCARRGRHEAASRRREAFLTIFRYIALVTEDSVAATLTAAIPEAKPQVKEATTTLAEKWIAEGEAKGRAEGEAKGRAEALRRLLSLKFGPFPESAATRIAGATQADLDRWLELVLSASKLEAILDN